MTQKVRENIGASGNSPYKLNVEKDKDRYTISLPITLTEDTEVVVTTKDGEKTRVILFGVQAEQ